MPRRNCLKRPVSRHPGDGRSARARSWGCRRKLTGGVDVERVAHPELDGVDQADHVAGERLLDRLPLLAEHGVGVLGGEGLARRPWVTAMPRSKRPEQTRTKAIRSRCDGSMLACTLKTKPGERGVEGARHAVDVDAGLGEGTRSTTASSSSRTPKLVSAEPKKTGVASPARKALGSSSAPTASSRPSSSWAVGPGRALLVGGALGGRRAPRAPSVAPRAVRVKRVKRRAAAVDHAPEVAGDADRPGHRRGRERRAAARSRRAARAASRPGRSHLLMKREQRQAPLAADLEELERLRLDALGRVEHHDRGVGRGQHPVGVLGEVAVAGRVEQVQDWSR